jgi:16S rRNA (adenine1518-N6/adenine1519-N6)-dimethyltransferase
MSAQILNVVDESGKILGEETRENIHRQGLLHKEIHVWLFTPNKEIVFQHRGKDKDTFPDLLDATVGVT